MRRAIAFLCLVLSVSPLLPPWNAALAEPARVEPLPDVRAQTDHFGIVEAFQSPELAKRSGARWQRIAFFWNSIQPNSPTEWLPNHNSTEGDVARALADGIKPIGVIGNPPAWATRNGSVPKNLDLPTDSPDNYWARFVERLARQYSGQIDEWIIWNEPDFTPDSPLSTWAGSEDEYLQLLQHAWFVIKGVDQRKKVVFAGTSYWFDVNRKQKLFFERVLDIAARDPRSAANYFYFDAVDVHLYNVPAHVTSAPWAYRSAMRKHGLDKPIWITEMNVVPTDDPVSKVPRGGYRASLDEQASYVIQALALARTAGIQRAGIYKLMDGEVIGGEPYGLVRNDGSVRPAYVAFQVAARYLSLPGQARHEKHQGWDAVVIDSGSTRVTALWATGPEPVETKITAGSQKAKLIAKDGSAVDMPSPVAGSSVAHTIRLPGATANTDDSNPAFYIIGGSPYILYEENAGQPFMLSPTEMYFPATGFSSAGAFYNYFSHRGGLRTFGYPISRQFKLEKRTVQFYQRQVMEMRTDGSIGLLNLLDQGVMPYTRINGATFPAFDEALAKSAPAPGSPDYGSRIIGFVKANAPDTWDGVPVKFGTTFQKTVTAGDAFPGKRVSEGELAGLNLELWGIPTSRPARDPNNANFVYQRYQRGIMHFDYSTGATQGLLLGSYLKALITGRDLPGDLESQANGSRFYRQYDSQKPLWLTRPGELVDTDLTNAFEVGR